MTIHLIRSNAARCFAACLLTLLTSACGTLAYAQQGPGQGQRRQPERPPVPHEPLAPAWEPANHAALRATPPGLRMEASAVDPQVFHVIIALDTLTATGAPSPFVVETTYWPGAKLLPGNAGSMALRTPGGTLALSPNGNLALLDTSGKPVWSASPKIDADGLLLTVEHPSSDRFYGSGNAENSQSGGLIHTSAETAVGNGYTRIPFIWTPGGYGFLIANNMAGISWQENGGRLQWAVPAKFIDLYVMVGATPYALLDDYSRLTGRAPVPPSWTLGFLMSRWGYADAADVRDKWYQFHQRGIPVDAFIYDYDWFVNDWEFNPKTFPDPARNLGEMHTLGEHFVGIIKPRVNGEHYDYADQRGWLMARSDMRFDLPEVRKWWADFHVPLVQQGVDGWWNDEAENSYDEFFYLNVAERDAWQRATDRPFWSINRAFVPGFQRLGTALWTGDIACTWDALANQPGTLLNWSLCGQPYVGQDIGGFRGTPTPELYARWMEEGALVPVMRAHGTFNSPRWPWAFGAEAEQAARKAILLRNRLRPYLEDCAREAATTGAPLMRPLFLEFPNDPATYSMEHEWLLGRKLLCAPVLAPGGQSDVYLPAGLWYEYDTGKPVRGPVWIHRTVPLTKIPMYIRGAKSWPTNDR